MTPAGLSQLIEVLPPPASPPPTPATWAEAEADLGVRFPESYKELLDRYGLGVIGNELPLFDARHLDLFHQWVDPRADELRNDHAAGEAPLPGFPSPGPSLLPVAANGDGDAICLVVDAGHAQETPIWIGNIHDLDWLEVPGPLIPLVFDVLTSGPMSEPIVERFGEYVWALKATFRPTEP